MSNQDEELYYSDYEHYREYRDQLIDGEQKVSEGLDKAILAISSAALGLTFTLIKSLVGESSVNEVIYLKWGCSLLGLSLFSVLVSLSIAGLLYHMHRVQCDKIMMNRSEMISAIQSDAALPDKLEFEEHRKIKVTNLIFHYMAPLLLISGVLMVGMFFNANIGANINEPATASSKTSTATAEQAGSKHTSSTTTSPSETNATKEAISYGQKTSTTSATPTNKTEEMMVTHKPQVPPPPPPPTKPSSK